MYTTEFGWAKNKTCMIDMHTYPRIKGQNHFSQVNYLTDEALNTGKGANSMLHHYMEHHSVGESDLTLHEDNCSGQNKN